MTEKDATTAPKPAADDQQEVGDLAEYTVEINGVETTVQLDAATAKERGAKKASHSNKAVTPDNK